METENNEIEKFVGDFGRFYERLNNAVDGLEEENIVTLYAIYRKNDRAERMNNGGFKPSYPGKPKSNPNAPATDKQKGLVGSLIKKGKVEEVDPDGLTKREASRILDEAFGKRSGR